MYILYNYNKAKYILKYSNTLYLIKLEDINNVYNMYNSPNM